MMNNNSNSSINISCIEELSTLFPRLCYKSNILTVIKHINAFYSGYASNNAKRYLYRKGLLHRLGNSIGKHRYTQVEYKPTLKCIIIMTLALEQFKDNRVIMNMISDDVYRGNRLALALAVIGLVDGRDSSIHNTIREYAKNHVIEHLDDTTIGDLLLEFLSKRLEQESTSIQGYINVLKDFTPNTLDSVLRVIIASVKPSVNDYNAFINLMHEVVRFYYDPIRVAYMHIIEDKDNFRERLEEYKRSNDLAKITDGKVELSIKLDSKHSRFLSMPYYMQIMLFKLMLEPKEFMLKELERYIWN
jgi:hypothetical protein